MKRISKLSWCSLTLLVLGRILFATQYYCDSTAEIQAAMQSVQPGDSIIISSGEYTGSADNSGNSKACFYSGVNGIVGLPIIMMSADTSARAVLSGDNINDDYVLYLTGNFWKIYGIDISGGRKGVMLDNANSVEISHVNVYNIGEEGIHVRDGSSFCKISNCKISSTGRLNPQYGEGIYIGSAKSNWDNYNEFHINTEIRKCIIGPGVTAESIDIKEGTFATIVDSCLFRGEGISGQNYADSFIDIKGNYNLISNNQGYQMDNEYILDAFQTHQIIEESGIDNLILNNDLHLEGDTYVLDASSGNAVVDENHRYPAGNMYKGNYSYNSDFLPILRIKKHLLQPVYTTNDTLRASFFAMDLDGQIDRVDFFLNHENAGQDNSPPYDFMANDLEAGDYQLFGRVFDNDGNMGHSDTIAIQIIAETTDNHQIVLDSANITASTDDGNIPANTIDGDLSTRWSAEGDGQWLKFDLQQLYSLSAIKIAFFKGDQRVTYFDIETSVDGDHWEKPIDNAASSGLTNELERFPLPNSRARYLRYIGHKNSSNDWNSLTEVEIWSSDSITTGIEKMRVPENFSLYQNYPNPFNSATTIKFEMSENKPVKLQVFDLHGRLVDLLVEDVRKAGYHKYKWDASGYSSGIYFCRLTTNNYSKTIKMVYLK